MSDDDESETDYLEIASQITEGAQTSKAMQTRYSLIPDKHLNDATQAGIIDSRLGRIKNGKPTGKPIIRFDNPHAGCSFYHINIDPNGVSNKNNPHINVPKNFIKAAKISDKALKYGGKALKSVALVTDTVRIGNALKNDLSEVKNNEATITEKYPSTIKTTVTVASEWTCSSVCAYGGMRLGASVGEKIGSSFGPGGSVIGSVIGAISGALFGSGVGNVEGHAVGENIADNFIFKK